MKMIQEVIKMLVIQNLKEPIDLMKLQVLGIIEDSKNTEI